MNNGTLAHQLHQRLVKEGFLRQESFAKVTAVLCDELNLRTVPDPWPEHLAALNATVAKGQNIQRQILLRAAKLTCDRCGDGRVPELRDTRQWGPLWFHKGDDGCDAGRIHDLLAQLPDEPHWHHHMGTREAHWQEAAKLVCRGCADDSQPLEVGGGAGSISYSHSSGDCKAWAIHDELFQGGL